MRLYPKGMRPSSLTERKEFYEREFDLRDLSVWIGDRGKSLKFAMVPGRYTGVVKAGKESIKNDVILIESWRRTADLRRFALDYLPESMYYDRNRYIDVRKCRECREPGTCHDCDNYDGQQLAFDLDPENVDCPYHGHIGQKMDAGRAHALCMYEFKVVRKQSIRLAEELRREYRKVIIAYSGRGFHVIVDDESAYHLTRRERKGIARRLSRRYDIDEWVTEGSSRLMRLPGSLNGLVSRKCRIIKDEGVLPSFDPRTLRSVIPGFMRRV